MSDENINNQDELLDSSVDDVEGSLKDIGESGKRVASSAAKKGVNLATNALKKKLGMAALTAIKSTVIMLGYWLGIPLLIMFIVMMWVYGDSVENKQYSVYTEKNKVEGDSYEVYNGQVVKESSISARMKTSTIEYDTSKKTTSRVVLSEGNQAIENYHYYNSTKSVLDNKIYIPLKKLDLEKKAEEMYKQLIDEKIIVEEGNERFISENSLTAVENAWKNQYGSSAGSFTWTDVKLKNKLDPRINKGITVKGFKDEHIGKIKKITEENKKAEIKDIYGREEYFQLPEELLSSLNKSMYLGEFIYDEPFVQGVKYKYKKEEDTKEETKEKSTGKEKTAKSSKSSSVNKEKADNSVYTAELFNKFFAKKNGLLKGTGQKFIDYANKYDIDAALAVAIAIQESGYGTSDLAVKNYNFFGMRAVSGGWRKFNSVEEGIEGGISYISRKYISQGITNLTEIGKIYCVPPEGWIEKVGNLYKTITGKEYEGSSSGQGYGSNLTEFRGVPEYTFKLDSSGFNKDKNIHRYGLGTVFMYKPTVEIQVKRGYKIEQTISSSLGEKKQVGKETVVDYNGSKNPNQSQTVIGDDGKKVNKVVEYEVKEVSDGKGGTKKVQVKKVYDQEIIYKVNATATPIEEIDAKIVYVLDKAVTFAGVYEFKYGLEVEDVGGESNTSERQVEGAKDKNGKQLSEMSKVETRAIKIYEKPMEVENKYINTDYMDKYLNNFNATVPKNIIKRFDVNKLINAFKGEKKISTMTSSSDSSDGSNTSAAQSVERWRPLAEEAGKKWGIDPNLILALIHNESTGNPHAQNPNYKGLLAIGATNFQEYFKGDPEFGGYTANDRVPSCPTKGPHDEAEHERVAKFQIEYAARRLSAQMGLYLQKIKGVDYRTDTISPEDLQNAILFTCAAYQTGEYGQLVAVDFHGESTLYGNKGLTYEKLFVEYIKGGGKYMYAKTPAVKKILSKYRFVNSSNRTYMKKTYTHYPLYSGGLDLDQVTLDAEKLKLFNPSLWYKHPSLGKKEDNSGNASEAISTSKNGQSMNVEKIEKYKEFEKTGGASNGKVKKGTVRKSLDPAESELIRKSAIGMIESIPAYDVKSTKNVFWGEGYAKEYFENGIAIKPIYGDELGNSIWNGKIRESSLYTGDKDSIIDLSKMYGAEVYNIIKRAVGQEGKGYQNGKSGPYAFDDSGLLWYVFNYNSSKKYFDKESVEGYYKAMTLNVEEGDIRPGDIIFYTKDKTKEVPEKIGIYLGQKAYLYIDEEEGVVSISSYESLKENQNYKVLAERRIINYASNSGNASIDSSVVGQLPADLLKGDWADPLGGVPYKDNGGVQPARLHPVYKVKKFHAGADRGIPTGTPVYSMKAGTVITAQNDADGYGLYVVVNHGDGYTSLYAHLSKIQVKVGQQVNKGQQVGLSGNTGTSTGPHLHVEIAKGAPNHTNGKRDLYPNGSYLCPNKIVPGNPR